MMRGVLEDSVEGFVLRFRSAAADVALGGHVEGSPLLECVVGGVAIDVFERTGPYLARSGAARVILHVECEGVERLAPDAPVRLEVTGVSALRVDAAVVSADEPFLVLDAGFPLVVGVTGAFPEVRAGDVVRVEARAPVHGFVLPRPTARAPASLDDQV